MTKKYIHFRIARVKPKTNVYSVCSNSDDQRIGLIYWHGAWRQYVFEPHVEVIWSIGCINELSKFLGKLKTNKKLVPGENLS